jgi:hypothetical protein
MGCQYLGGIYNSDVITITLKKDSMISCGEHLPSDHIHLQPDCWLD